MVCRATTNPKHGKRSREEPELSDVSNDENDPAVANQAVSARHQPRKKAHVSKDENLSESALATIKEVIQGMLQIRGWTGSATISALQARAASAGHNFSEPLLLKVFPRFVSSMLRYHKIAF